MKSPNFTDLTKKNFALWGVIAFLCFVVIPIFLKVPEPYQKVLLSIGTALFVGLTVSYFINKKIGESTSYEVKGLLKESFPKLLEFDDIGLHKVTYENSMSNLGIDLVNSDKLYIVMNDGKNFFTNNSKDLSKRFSLEDKQTVVILMSDESESEGVLNSRNKKTEEGYYGRKIRESINDYLSFHKNSPATNKLDIYQYGFNFTMSIVATENIAVVGTYRNAAGKSLVPPHFVFKNNGSDSEFNNIMKDVNNLIEQSNKSRQWTQQSCAPA
ncbi:hypothetical protein tinsulaeT_18670 [Thalassotalea insulae]|uniref:Uncharacterized protein n=1 Tax=Thalassotalea insulae TaxID=2056778 RepID=A0ABQ6GV50_9GAMM|nr:hypothetical protein [Thalassotalea insulae]GLX78527.1 hypothetical protein tinsulaeT_18670 [Thalassotalea insulae]